MNNSLKRLVKIRVNSVFCYSEQRHFHPSTRIADSKNPFHILGIPVNSDYDTAKKAFIEAANKHHPDREGGSTEAFLRIRNAFDSIRSSNVKAPKVDDDEVLRRWFKPEVREFLSFDMSEKTRQEVIHVYKTMAQGGKDKGGYWEMARQLSERDRSTGDPLQPIHSIAAGCSSLPGRRRRKTS